MSLTQSVSPGRSQPAGLYEVLDLILDKGLVIDAFVRLSIIGIEILTLDVRVVVASVDTYLHFAEATNRLDLSSGRGGGLPDLAQSVSQGGARGKTQGVLSGAAHAVSSALGHGGDEQHATLRGQQPDEGSQGEDED